MIVPGASLDRRLRWQDAPRSRDITYRVTLTGRETGSNEEMPDARLPSMGARPEYPAHMADKLNGPLAERLLAVILSTYPAVRSQAATR